MVITPNVTIIDTCSWITASSTVVLVLVTGFYAYITNQIFKNQKEKNDLYQRPCLGFEGISVKSSPSATQSNSFDIQIGIILKNAGSVLLKYEVKNIVVSIDNKCLHNPHFNNTGSFLFPGQVHEFRYDILKGVSAAANICSGLLEYDIEYCFVSNRKYRTRKKMSLDLYLQTNTNIWTFLEEEEIQL